MARPEPRPGPATAGAVVSRLHPRNRHTGRYDFPALVAAAPALGEFVRPTAHGELSIDFANPDAVRALNGALLAHHYRIQGWSLPAHCLCPSVPGRADYLHYLADLLAASNAGVIPKTPVMSALDIGTGASCIYPLIGRAEYGWDFVATDCNADSLRNAEAILTANPRLGAGIALRLQASPTRYFDGVVGADDWFDLSLCNPPFHASAAAAQEGSARKWRNLGKSVPGAATLNFGGQDRELFCPGGEQAFIEGLIAESARIPYRCFWFTSLVSKSATLPALDAALTRVGVLERHSVSMRQGQKESRFLAWTFLKPEQQKAWRKLRW